MRSIILESLHSMSTSKHSTCSPNCDIITCQLAYLHQVLNIDLLLLSSGEGHKELGKHALHLEGLQDRQVQGLPGEPINNYVQPSWVPSQGTQPSWHDNNARVGPGHSNTDPNRKAIQRAVSRKRCIHEQHNPVGVPHLPSSPLRTGSPGHRAGTQRTARPPRQLRCHHRPAELCGVAGSLGRVPRLCQDLS